MHTETNAALSISIEPLNKEVFSLAGIQLCHKLNIFMLNLVMVITHFCQKCKGHPPKCVFRQGLSVTMPDTKPGTNSKPLQCVLIRGADNNRL